MSRMTAERDSSPGHFASPYRDGSVPPKCPAATGRLISPSHFNFPIGVEACRPPHEAPGARRLHRLDVRFRQRDDNRRVSVHANNSEFGRTANLKIGILYVSADELSLNLVKIGR